MGDLMRILSIRIEDFSDDKKVESINKYLKNGASKDLYHRLHCFRKHLHDIFLTHIGTRFGYKFMGDIDSNVILDSDLDLTPDLYDPSTKRWGDVALTYNSHSLTNEKKLKYLPLLSDSESTLSLYVFDLNDFSCKETRVKKNELDEKVVSYEEKFFLDPDFLFCFTKAVNLFQTSSKIVEAEREPEEEPVYPDQGLNEEALELSMADGGVLNDLLNNNSFDSELENKEVFRRHAEKHLTRIANRLVKDSLKAKSNFKRTESYQLEDAYKESEAFVKENYIIMHKPKTSCHGLGAKIEKLKASPEDTRDVVIMNLLSEIKDSRISIFQELKTLIEKNCNKLYPERMQKIESLKKEVESFNMEKLSPAQNEMVSQLKKEESKVKWDRDSLQTQNKSFLNQAMRINIRKEFKLEKVKTYTFWKKRSSAPLRHYIHMKANLLVPEEHQWTPHKDYIPDLKECKDLYYRFIASELYQEIAYVGQLSDNILRMATRSRSYCSITTCANPNLMAIIGPGDGCMNEHCTIPLLWISLNSSDSPLWSKAVFKTGNVLMSDGDRLTKNRLEQMMDAPRIASVAAAVVLTQMTGTVEQLMYACGVLACVAMSINIRDSELIDHIRYMIPNIFSDRSCAADYIVDKYANPLKTQLQALIYQETKGTILKSADLSKRTHDVVIEEDAVVVGGTNMIIPFLGCEVDSVFKLNGIVYTAFFSCKKGLHSARVENKKMFSKICEYEYPNTSSSLSEACFNPSSPHFFDPKYVAFSVNHMINKYIDTNTWRNKMKKMDNLKKPFELNTFSSLRSSMKKAEIIPEIRMLTTKNLLTSSKHQTRAKQISECYEEIWSDARTRVVDHFYDIDKTILELGSELIENDNQRGFFSTWDQKRQRTGRDREVFILDPEGKVLMHNVESLFKVVCENTPHESITLPGNKKILSMAAKGTQFFKTLNKLKEDKTIKQSDLEWARFTMDMTKWAPGDNVCKFIYAIAALNFLKKQEKITYINFLCTSLRKTVIMNSVATESVGAILEGGHLKADSMWAKMLGVSVEEGIKCKKVKGNCVKIKFNWLMGVLNCTSSAVHAASMLMIERVLLCSGYNIHHFQPDVHSDDAALDVIVSSTKDCKVSLSLFSYLPRVFTTSLKQCCIKLSEKKSYIDKSRKEFVSELDDNGMMRSYWQKQAIASISGLSYVDFFKDLAEGCSKIANIISLGGPPSVFQVALSNVIDVSRETYSMKSGMWNDVSKFTKYKPEELPLELGGSFNFNPVLLPITGVKYQNFSKMMDQILSQSGKASIDKITDEDLDKLSFIQGNIFSKVWFHTTEIAAKDNLMMDKVDPSLIKFKQFSSHDKVSSLRVMKELKDVAKEVIDEKLEEDPTFSLRSSSSVEEHKIKLAQLIKNPSWFASATLQSQGALKLDRMFNVKSPCCSPVLNPGEPMQKGLKTIREAITEAIEELEKRDVDLKQVYYLLKSMPFMCYIYDLEHKALFKKIGTRNLYPVPKETFFDSSIISSSAIGLLQQHFTGETDYRLDHTELERELELMSRYTDAFASLEKHHQAAAIYKIISQKRTYASVLFVPSPKMRGHNVLPGLLSLQFSDHFAYIPKKKYSPPQNEFYVKLHERRELTPAQKCSELACFLMKVCKKEVIAKRLLANCRIDDVPVTTILDDPKVNFRQSAYAKAVMGTFTGRQLIPPHEIIWALPQTRGHPHWVGQFICYLNVGTKLKPRGMLIWGEETFITHITLLGEAAEFPDMKTTLTFFANKMGWKGSLLSHIRTIDAEENDEGEGVLSFKNYKDSQQVRYVTEGKGLKIICVTDKVQVPTLELKRVERDSLVFEFCYGDLRSEIKTYRQSLTDFFNVTCEKMAGPVSLETLWNEGWHSISIGSKINLEMTIFPNDSNQIHLYEHQLKRVNEICKAEYKSACPGMVVMQGTQVDQVSNDEILKKEAFTSTVAWTDSDYNFYLSLAVQKKSKLMSWIALKGYILGFTDQFTLIRRSRLRKTISNPRSKYCESSNMVVKDILLFSSSEANKLRKRNQKKLDDFSSNNLKGKRWADVSDNESSEHESSGKENGSSTNSEDSDSSGSEGSNSDGTSTNSESDSESKSDSKEWETNSSDEQMMP